MGEIELQSLYDQPTMTTPDALLMKTYYHVTVLSNFAQAFDKYRRCYDKAALIQSHFPQQFFVLHSHELSIGLQKAQQLLERLNLPQDRLLVLCARLDPDELYADHASGRGQYLKQSFLPIDHVAVLDAAGQLQPISDESAYADSLRILHPQLHDYAALQPRSLSVLPIAQACQAACRFCFSESSVSVEQTQHPIDVVGLEGWCHVAQRAGASRFVITGGGESGLLPHAQLVALIGLGARYFKRTTLISNGYHLAKHRDIAQRLADYQAAGLSVLSLSRHHHDPIQNAQIMGLDTQTERVLQAIQQTHITPRLVVVLQRGGIDDAMSLRAYVDWAVAQGVRELCFKELYISTLQESAYHDQPNNQWSREHQVSLSLITHWFAQWGFEVSSRLPWGAPILTGQWQGQRLAVAAYTEPSVFWERSRGMARSWNLMADGRCLVSLEDQASQIRVEDVALPVQWSAVEVHDGF